MASRPIFVALVIADVALEGVRQVVIEREIGRPARATITVVLPEPVPTADWLGQPASVVLGHEAVEHAVVGVITEAALRATELEGAFGVRLVVESALAVLALSVDHRIFMDLDVKEIVTQVLEDHGIAADRQKWSLTDSYAKRPMCVQYEESALDFVTRLLEEEGISYVCSSDDDGEVLAFFDKSSSVETIAGDAVRFERSVGLDSSADAFVALDDQAELTSGKISLRDYDFEKPALDVSAAAESDAFAALERYEAHLGPVDPAELDRWAKVRLEAAAGGRRRLHLSGHCLRMSEGLLFTLSEAPGDLDGDYLVVRTTHHFDDSKGEGLLRTEVFAQPKATPYRLPLTTPLPVAWGHDTAFVVAPDGSDVETIHTDEHARAKVRYRWDRSGRGFDDASAWMRVAQMQTAGSQILPRIGWEVVVEYVEGDPDRPVVTGRLYNGAIMPPYALPEGKTRTALQSASTPGGKGRNEIRIEDAKGKEEVAISAQKNQTIVVANDSTESVTVNQKRDIGANLTSTVGGDELIQITSGVKTAAASESLTVGGTREVTVAAVMGASATGAISTSIGGSLSAMIGSPLSGLLDLAGEVAAEVVEAKAAEAVAAIQEKAQGKVDQLLGSVGDLAAQATGVSDAMDAVSQGAPGGMGRALDAAGGLPDPSALGPWASNALGVNDALGGLAEAAMAKVHEATGADGAGGGGESQANEGGPDGAMPANAAAQGACGPGHSILHAQATLDEVVSGSKITLAAGKVTTVAGGARTITVGAARIELTAGDRVESSASKTESALGRVVLSKGGIAESASGANDTMVGGAILEKVGGNAAIEAGGLLSMAAALWKVTASGSIVLKCGGSSVTIAGSGIAVASPSFTLMSPSITLPKSGSEK